MRLIPGWAGPDEIEVTESEGGVLATVDPFSGLYRPEQIAWPPPEVLQKLYASDRWRGKTSLDNQLARSRFGQYCDLQSLNSEDAITWSFFGPLIYGLESARLEFATRLFKRLELPGPTRITIWLWRRIPHPEKADSTGGPEIDVGFQSDTALVLGEAKWNSKVSSRQGVQKNRTQLDLRLAFCSGLCARALPEFPNRVVLGIGRAGGTLNETLGGSVRVANTTWRELLSLMPRDLVKPLTRYLDWKERYSTPLRLDVGARDRKN